MQSMIAEIYSSWLSEICFKVQIKKRPRENQNFVYLQRTPWIDAASWETALKFLE